MADINPIKIFKGDDTDFNGGKWLTINLTTDLDLTGFIGVFTLDKFKVTKSAASKSIAHIPACPTGYNIGPY